MSVAVLYPFDASFRGRRSGECGNKAKKGTNGRRGPPPRKVVVI